MLNVLGGHGTDTLHAKVQETRRSAHAEARLVHRHVWVFYARYQSPTGTSPGGSATHSLVVVCSDWMHARIFAQ